MSGTSDSKQRSEEEQRTRRQKLEDGVRALIDHVPEDRLQRTLAWFSGWGFALRYGLALVILTGIVVGSMALLASGNHLLLVRLLSALFTAVLTGWAVFHIAKGEDKSAALPLAILGGLAVAAWPFLIAAGGYSGDRDRGYFLPLLTVATIAVSLVWLLKRDKPVFALTAVTLGLTVFIHLMLSIVTSFKVIEPAGLAVAAVLSALTVFVVLTTMMVGRSGGIVVSLIAVASYLMDWWMFGDPHDQPALGLTLVGDGRFDQLGLGVLILAFAAVLRWYEPPPGPKPKTEDPSEAETEERPAAPEEGEDAFIADQPEEVKEAWCRLPAEQRQLIPKVLEHQLYVAPVVDDSDAFDEEFLRNSDLGQAVRRTGLEPGHYLYFASRKATTVLAELADRRGIVPEEHFRSTTAPPGVRDKFLAGAAKLAEKRGIKLQDVRREEAEQGIRSEILEEMGITAQEIRSEQARLAVPV